MNKQDVIAQIYPDLDTLEKIPHPKDGLIYDYLAEKQLIELAHKTLGLLLETGIRPH